MTPLVLGPIVGRAVAAFFAIDARFSPHRFWDFMRSGPINESKQDQLAEADGIYFPSNTTGLGVPTAYTAGNWSEYDFDDLYPDGMTVTEATLAIHINACITGAGVPDPSIQSYYFFEVRRRSTDALLATYGSSGAPWRTLVGAGYGLQEQVIAELTDTTDVNDLYIKLWAWKDNSTINSVRLDMMRLRTKVAGIGGEATHFTWYQRRTANNGGSFTSTKADLIDVGGTERQSRQIATANEDGRYMRWRFDAYDLEPPNVTKVMFRIVVGGYPPDDLAGTDVWSMWVEAGLETAGTSLGFVGSFAAPLHTWTGTAWQTFDVDLTSLVVDPDPAVTIARLKDLRVHTYFKGDTINDRLRFDLVHLYLDYSAP